MEISRPIYIRPKLDVLFLDFLDISVLADTYPKVNEIESVAIHSRAVKTMIWEGRGFSGMKKLLVVTSENPNERRLPNRCCTAIKLSPDATDKAQLEWEEALSSCPPWSRLDFLANIQPEGVVAEFIHRNSY